MLQFLLAFGLLNATAGENVITSLEVSFPDDLTICPNTQIPLEVNTVDSTGKERTNNWEDLELEAPLPSIHDAFDRLFNRDNVLYIPHDPSVIWPYPGFTMTIKPRSGDASPVSTDLPFSYTCAQSAYFGGTVGSNGRAASTRWNATLNRNVTTRATSGNPGTHAPYPVDVWVTLVTHPISQEPILQIKVADGAQKREGANILGNAVLKKSRVDSRERKTALYAITAGSTSLSVDASGGDGGQPGNGLGGYTEGAGGDGQDIVVYYDPSAAPHLDQIHLDTSGGDGSLSGSSGTVTRGSRLLRCLR